MAALRTLPNELLDHIFSYLSTEPPPSTQNLRDFPSHELTCAPDAPLKSTSRVCSRFHALSRPRLFAHARYELRDQARFLAFYYETGLSRHVKTVAVSVRTVYGSEQPRWWTEVVRALEPDTITVIAPPYVFADMAGTTLYGKDNWAFNVPLQIMQFRQKDPRNHAFELSDSDDTFFGMRPWSAIHFNEGSSLRAYSTYEYFLLRMPSLMDTWGQSLSSPSASPPAGITPSPALSRLTSFDYTAIFPFYNHTNLVLKLLRTMTALQSFTILLSPSPGSTLLDEEKRDSGALDTNDPWMELETSYALVAHTVRFLGAQWRLKEFRTWDYRVMMLREVIDGKLERVLNEGWVHDGGGRWNRRLEDTPAEG